MNFGMKSKLLKLNFIDIDIYNFQNVIKPNYYLKKKNVFLKSYKLLIQEMIVVSNDLLLNYFWLIN